MGKYFSPCEIIGCFGLSTLSIECLSCYFSGYHLEDYFIDYAQNTGIAPTLCSYHKTFVGAIDSGSVPVPEYAVTTSLSCDGNLNTFRYLEKEREFPLLFSMFPTATMKLLWNIWRSSLRPLQKSWKHVFTDLSI